MTDYPFKPRPGQKPWSLIRLLRDVDGDGQFDETTSSPTDSFRRQASPLEGGRVRDLAAGCLAAWKDTDGDHKADVRRKVYTGFGTGNEQGMLNNLDFRTRP